MGAQGNSPGRQCHEPDLKQLIAVSLVLEILFEPLNELFHAPTLGLGDGERLLQGVHVPLKLGDLR